jgi:hypothetical protein
MPRRNLMRGNDLDQFHPTDAYPEVGHFQNPVVPVRSIRPADPGPSQAQLFGFLIGSGAIVAVAGGYAVAAVLMLIAAAAEFKFGIDAEGRSLESIAEPLSSA